MYFRITKGEKGLNIKTYPSNTDKMVTWTGIPATCTPTYPELDKLFWKLHYRSRRPSGRRDSNASG